MRESHLKKKLSKVQKLIVQLISWLTGNRVPRESGGLARPFETFVLVPTSWPLDDGLDACHLVLMSPALVHKVNKKQATFHLEFTGSVYSMWRQDGKDLATELAQYEKFYIFDWISAIAEQHSPLCYKFWMQLPSRRLTEIMKRQLFGSL